MAIYARSIWVVLAKDVMNEWRTKDIFSAAFAFAFLTMLVFSFALGLTPINARDVAPGALWVAFSFGGILGINRSFIAEKDRGSLEGLLLAPIDRSTIFCAKAVGNFLFMLLVEALTLPIFFAFFGISDIGAKLAGLLPVLLLGTLGFAEVGTVFAAIAVNTRAREVLLPVLFFPIALPCLLGAVEGTNVVLTGTGGDNYIGALGLMAGFDLIFLLMPIVIFELIMED